MIDKLYNQIANIDKKIEAETKRLKNALSKNQPDFYKLQYKINALLDKRQDIQYQIDDIHINASQEQP